MTLPAGVSPGLLFPPITPVPIRIATTRAARPSRPNNATNNGLQQTEFFLGSHPKLSPAFAFLLRLSSILSILEYDFLNEGLSTSLSTYFDTYCVWVFKLLPETLALLA